MAKKAKEKKVSAKTEAPVTKAAARSDATGLGTIIAGLVQTLNSQQQLAASLKAQIKDAKQAQRAVEKERKQLSKRAAKAA